MTPGRRPFFATMERQIYIHAGGHRTGSSSFQMCLHDNLDAIHAAGFDTAYPQRDGIKSGTLGMRLPAPRHGMGGLARFAGAVSREIDKQNPDPARPLILSEENLPGRMTHFYAGQFYPAAEARFTSFRRGIGPATIRRIVMVVRAYDELMVSAHRKRAEDRLVHPFSDSTAAMARINRGWPELIGIMQAILQPEEFIVVPYEARGSSRALVQLLVPEIDAKQLKRSQQALNVSATDTALVALQDRYHKGETLERDAWKAVIAAHKDEQEDLGFSEFSPEQTAALDRRYRVDLDRLSQMGHIKFVG